MFLKKLKLVFKKLLEGIELLHQQNNLIISQNKITYAQNTEIEWANIFRDTINGRVWLQDLAVSPGRYAVNYSFFYILSRILIDFKPLKILEFGLGESSKFVSTMLDNELKNSNHIIIENNIDWINSFNKRFKLSLNSKIRLHEIRQQKIKEFDCYTYDKLEVYAKEIMDLYLVDGVSSDRYSRFYILGLFETVKTSDEFIIIIDDYERIGENDTVVELTDLFTKKGILIYSAIYSGIKSQCVIATEKYKFAISL